jgi:hypothetical protein
MPVERLTLRMNARHAAFIPTELAKRITDRYRQG